VRIFLLDVNYDHSSTGKIVKDLETGLKEHGHHVLACYGRAVGALTSNAVRIANPFEVYGHAALTRLTGKTGGYSPFATQNIIKNIEIFRPDVVHLHELHGYYVNIGDLIEYLKKNNIATLWTFHCEFMYTGKCGHAHGCEQWKIECVRCPQLKDYPESWFLDRTNKMFHEKRAWFTGFNLLKIITPSHWLANRVRQSFLAEKEIGVIYNGIDTGDIFTPKDASALRRQHHIATRHVVVTIAPDLMSESKGGRWVLEVAARLAAEDITFVMIGVSEPDRVQAGNVIALPRVNDQKLLAHYYSMGDFFLLTSKKETFSLACAESLACGTPIIGFDSGAPTEVAGPGYGHFVDYADIDALSVVLLASLRDPSAFHNGAKCAEYARSSFSKEAMIDSHLEAYRELIDRSKELSTGIATDD
jgi:glycosyltransferase involved in cell wall biosynthesis